MTWYQCYMSVGLSLSPLKNSRRCFFLTIETQNKGKYWWQDLNSYHTWEGKTSYHWNHRSNSEIFGIFYIYYLAGLGSLLWGPIFRRVAWSFCVYTRFTLEDGKSDFYILREILFFSWSEFWVSVYILRHPSHTLHPNKSSKRFCISMHQILPVFFFVFSIHGHTV